MSAFLVETLLGNIPLVSTNKLFKSPSGLIFECCGIARDVPVHIEKTKVILDFHIYAILDFDILIGYPLENLTQEKPSGSLDEKLGETAIANPCPKIPMAKQYPTSEEVKCLSSFVSLKLACENEHPSSLILEQKPCPSGHQNIVLENENFCAMDNPKAPTLEFKETPHVSCSLLELLELTVLRASRSYEDPNHLLILVHKLFKRMVVDAYVYHKHCKSRSSMMAIPLQLKHKSLMLGGNTGK